MIDYLNGLSDQPFLKKSIEPEDPRLYVVHRSEEGMFIYRLTGKVNRLEPEGYRELLVPRRDEAKVADPFNAEPVDETLRGRLDQHPFHKDPPPGAIQPSRNAHEHALSMQVDRMLESARNGDWQAFSRDTQTLAAMDAGRNLQQQATRTVDLQEQSAISRPLQDAPTQPVPEQRGPMR